MTETYQDRLILALRLKDVPGDRIGEIVAQVDSHVAETGEDPVEAFGTPKAYAASLTDEHRPEPRLALAASIACSALFGWLFVQGGVVVALGDTYWGQSGWVWIAVSLAIGIPGGWRILHRSTRVVDPRTGDEMVPFSLGGVLMFVGLPLLLTGAAICSALFFN